MKSLKSLMLLAPLALLVSCAAPQELTKDGMKVKVYGSKPPSDCEVQAKVVGHHDLGSVELARNHARNQVASKGANAITFDEEVQNGKQFRVHATGYMCP